MQSPARLCSLWTCYVKWGNDLQLCLTMSLRIKRSNVLETMTILVRYLQTRFRACIPAENRMVIKSASGTIDQALELYLSSFTDKIVTPKCWSPNSQYNCIWDTRAFKEVVKVKWGQKGGSNPIGLVSLKEKEECVCRKKKPGEDAARRWLFASDERGLTRNQSWHLDLRLPLWENKFLFFKLSSLWYFVMVAEKTNMWMFYSPRDPGIWPKEIPSQSQS